MEAAMLSAPVVPARNIEQRMVALGKANRIRSARAEMKRDLKAKKATVSDILGNPPEFSLTMKVFDLLVAAPKTGRVKANKALVRMRISPSRTIGGLSERQRAELLADFG